MKAQKLKQGIEYDTPKKNYIKSTMYEFEFSTDIMVMEDQKQKDGSIDQTFLHFMLREGEKAYFSEEYLPAGMRKDGVKKPDITAIIESNVCMKIKWYVYDMKDTVINAKVAGKLCSQWHKGIEHLTKEYLETKTGYQIEDSVGVITRYWDRDKLQEDINTYEERLKNKNGLLTARKSLTKVSEYRERIRAAQNIIDGLYGDYDETSGEKNQYVIHYINLAKTESLLYTAHMDIRL